VVSLGLTNAANPFFKRTTYGTVDFGGFFSVGDYTLTAEVDGSPGNEGGTCTGSWSFTLDFMDP
jgi:hypothetical protein